jgi:hypothetical protein
MAGDHRRRGEFEACREYREFALRVMLGFVSSRARRSAGAGG